MNPSSIRTGVCPYKDYEKYKKDLENSGYKVLESAEMVEQSGTVVMFTYIKVQSAFKTMLSQ